MYNGKILVQIHHQKTNKNSTQNEQMFSILNEIERFTVLKSS